MPPLNVFFNISNILTITLSRLFEIFIIDPLQKMGVPFGKVKPPTLGLFPEIKKFRSSQSR
jgi:hypothetical protein